MNAELTGGMDEYALKHLAEHLYKSGPRMHGELYNLVTDIKWYQTQQDYDPSRRTYISGLDQAIQTAKDNKYYPPILFPLILIRATLNTLLENLPVSVIGVMSHIGLHKQVKHYTELLPHDFDKHKSLTQIAIAEWQEGNEEAAHTSLNEAEKLILAEPVSIQYPALIALIADTALKIHSEEHFNRSIQRLQTILENQIWPISQLVSEFDLLDRPNYLIAFAAEGLLNGEIDNDIKALPLIARLAGQEEDVFLLSKTVVKAKKNRGLLTKFSEDMVSALAEFGYSQKALEIILFLEEKNRDMLELRYTLARIAGQGGDVDIIEELIITTPEEDEDEDEYLDITERISGTTKKALKRTGKSLFGLGPNQMNVFLVSMAGLGNNHPKESKLLWERLQAHQSGIGKLVARQLAPMVLSSIGQEYTNGESINSSYKSQNKPSILLKTLNLGSKLAAFYPDEYDREEILYTLVEAKAAFGGIDQALQDLDLITSDIDREMLLESMTEISLNRGEVDNAIHLVNYFDEPSDANEAIDSICNYLLKLPPQEAKPYLQKIIKSIDQLPADESLQNSYLTTAILSSYAQYYSIKNTQELFGELKIEDTLSSLVALSEVAVAQNDFQSAENFLQRIKTLLTTHNFDSLLPNLVFLNYFQSLDYIYLHPCQALSELSILYTKASEKSLKNNREVGWISLAKLAFELAKKSTQNLPPDLKIWSWSHLARTARYLNDKNTLDAIWKKLQREYGIKTYLHDRTLVQLAIGFTFIGEYMSDRDKYFPDILFRFHLKPYKAQALVEMSQLVRNMPPKKKLFGGYDIDDLNFRADNLIKMAREELGVTTREYPSYSKFRTDTLSPKLSLDKYFDLKGSGNKRKESEPVGEALIKVIEVFADEGLYNDVIKVAKDITPEKERPIVYASAIKGLRKYGEKKQARELLDTLQPSEASTRFGLNVNVKNIAYASIAEDQAIKNPDKAWKTIKTNVLPDIWNSSNLPRVLEKCTQIVTQLKKEQIWEFVRLLVEEETLNRNQAVQRLATLAPILASLLGEQEYKLMVKKFFETETFW